VEVIKLGGVESEDSVFLRLLAHELATRDFKKNPCIIVHGGGKRITQLCEALGLPVSFSDGLRVTPPEVAQVVDMVLGTVGSSIVRTLLMSKVPCVSARGSDGLLRGSLHARASVLGRVGNAHWVDVELLQALLATGRIPVLSPVAVDDDGGLLNVNADHAAVAVALAMKATGLAFVSSVPGVLDGANFPLASLSQKTCDELIASSVIHGGMVPKVESALRARRGGIADVRIRGTLAGSSAFQGTRVD
jgi:acetylglutamate kinase